MLTVAIIGAGPLGRRLALAAARGGLRVFLEDIMPATLHHAQEYIRQELSPAALESAQPRIRFVSSIEDAVREADLAIDCVPDELESKLEIVWLLDRMSPPRTVIATPTAHLSISDLASCTYRPEKCVAIAASPGELAEGLGEEMLLRITARTAAAAQETILEFCRAVGVSARFELELEPAAGEKPAAEPSPSAG